MMPWFPTMTAKVQFCPLPHGVTPQSPLKQTQISVFKPFSDFLLSGGQSEVPTLQWETAAVSQASLLIRLPSLLRLSA